MAQGKAAVPCTRCSRQRLECEFAGLKRFGRPRRKAVASTPDEPANLKDEHDAYSEIGDGYEHVGDYEQPLHLFTEDPIVVEGAGWLEDMDDVEDSKSGIGGALVRTPSPVHSASSLPSSPIVSSFLSFDSAATSLYQRPLDFDHFTCLAQEYLDTVHPWVAILPDDRDVLAAYLRISSPALLMAVYSILGPSNLELVPLMSYGSTLSDVSLFLPFPFPN